MGDAQPHDLTLQVGEVVQDRRLPPGTRRGRPGTVARDGPAIGMMRPSPYRMLRHRSSPPKRSSTRPRWASTEVPPPSTPCLPAGAPILPTAPGARPRRPSAVPPGQPDRRPVAERAGQVVGTRPDNARAAPC